MRSIKIGSLFISAILLSGCGFFQTLSSRVAPTKAVAPAVPVVAVPSPVQQETPSVPPQKEELVVPPISQTTLFQEPVHHFSVAYPKILVLRDPLVENSNLALGFPQTYFQGTNLKEAVIRISAKSGSDFASKCLVDPYTSAPLTAVVKTTSGTPFYQFDIDDAGAGQKYYYRGYRALVNFVCYSVELQLDSSSVGNFEPPQPKEFNKKEIVGLFDEVFHSFEFTK